MISTSQNLQEKSKLPSFHESLFECPYICFTVVLPPNPTQFVAAKPDREFFSFLYTWCLVVSHGVSLCLIVSQGSVYWLLFEFIPKRSSSLIPVLNVGLGTRVTSSRDGEGESVRGVGQGTFGDDEFTAGTFNPQDKICSGS